MKSFLKLIAQLFSDERFERKVLAISVLVISFAVVIHVAAPWIPMFL